MTLIPSRVEDNHESPPPFTGWRQHAMESGFDSICQNRLACCQDPDIATSSCVSQTAWLSTGYAKSDRDTHQPLYLNREFRIEHLQFFQARPYITDEGEVEELSVNYPRGIYSMQENQTLFASKL